LTGSVLSEIVASSNGQTKYMSHDISVRHVENLHFFSCFMYPQFLLRRFLFDSSRNSFLSHEVEGDSDATATNAFCRPNHCWSDRSLVARLISQACRIVKDRFLSPSSKRRIRGRYRPSV